jgi:Ca-activated chloride channel family protein
MKTSMRLFVRASAMAMLVSALALAVAPQVSKAAPAQKTPAKQKAQTQKKPAAQKPPTVGQLKREVPLVDVVFSVLNKKDRFVTDLSQKDFEIFDNNLPQQIEFFSRQTDLPLRIGILLDTSNSIHSRLKFEKNAAFDFLFRNIRPGKDLAFVMTFDTHPEMQQGFTDNMNLLRKAIFSQRAGGGTALYDAIYDSCRDYLTNPPPPATGNNVRRVLVVFSDGNDDLSDLTRSSAIDMAERAGVAVYTISTNNKWVSPDQEVAQGLPYKMHFSHGDKVLAQFANDTGGRSFYPYRVTDLAQAFADIGTELRSQYSIAYTPSNNARDGKFHSIHIEILHENHLKVRARQGYWAERAPTSSSSKPGR